MRDASRVILRFESLYRSRLSTAGICYFLSGSETFGSANVPFPCASGDTCVSRVGVCFGSRSIVICVVEA